MAEIIAWVMSHGLEVIGAVVMVLNALIAVFMIVPGSEPEATLQKVVDFIAKFSKK